MVPYRTLAILPLIWLGAAGPGLAQGFNPPPGSGAPPMGADLSQKPGPAPMPDQFQAPGPTPIQPPQGFSAGQPQLGFANPPAVPPGQPVRQNYADELTDFGVPPQPEMQPNVGSPTPTTIPGGHIITTREMRQAGPAGILMFDVLQGPPHPEIPGAVWLPGAGSAGSFNDDTQRKLWGVLSQATQRNPDRPIAFFCAGSRCWESYNAALRAEQMGFKMVLWYRGGLAAWQVAGLPMSNPGQGGGEPPQQGRIGFGSPQGTAQGNPASQ